MQHRAPGNVRGRRRSRTALHSYRAPSTPVTAKGRYALAAALVAGVGVVGVMPATAGTSAAPAAAQTRHAAAQATLTSAASSGSASPSLTQSASLLATDPELSQSPLDQDVAPLRAGEAWSAVTQARKQKVLPAVTPTGNDKTLQLWVNPLPEGATTSCFGQRWGRLHAGVDLAAPNGTRIRAAGAGVVVAAGPADGYGNAVLIDHRNGYLTHYGHMSVIIATVGRQVEAGDEIGKEGSTGHSTGPHLHFEVHEGSYKNPIEPTGWMHEHGVDIPGCHTLPE